MLQGHELIHDRRRNFRQREQFEELRRDLLARLQNVSAGMPPEQLQRLTAQMVRLRLKYELRANWLGSHGSIWSS